MLVYQRVISFICDPTYLGEHIWPHMACFKSGEPLNPMEGRFIEAINGRVFEGIEADNIGLPKEMVIPSRSINRFRAVKHLFGDICGKDWKSAVPNVQAYHLQHTLTQKRAIFICKDLVGNGWVAGGCWDYYKILLIDIVDHSLIPSLRLAPVRGSLPNPSLEFYVSLQEAHSRTPSLAGA
jgi:hypothetical protein